MAADLRALDARALGWGALVLVAPLLIAVSTLYTKQRASGASSLILNRDGMLLGATLLGSALVLSGVILAMRTPARA